MMKKMTAAGMLAVLLISLLLPAGKTEAASGKVTVRDFIEMLEGADKRISIKTNMKSGKRLIMQDACVLLVKAYESLYGKRVSKKETDLIIQNRIYESGKISSKRVRWIAKAYAYGLV
ncbi:MAG: hypothetical protein J6X17_09230, partial [Lachnospiraceae bacterium]|nr:hypothetical protein [Lachnospiraceae bacterium]